MTPAPTEDEELMVERVERLGARRLAEIVVKHCHRDKGLYQAVRIALAASVPGGQLAKMLATERGSPNTFSPHSLSPPPSYLDVSSGSTPAFTNGRMTQTVQLAMSSATP